MSRDELKAMLRSSNAAASAITSWLRAEGVRDTHVHDDGHWVNFAASTEDVERLLNAKFHVYRHEGTNTVSIRTLQYSLPAALHEHVHMIQPTTRFGHTRPERSTIFQVLDMKGIKTPMSEIVGWICNSYSCGSAIHPRCLQDLYGLHEPSRLASKVPHIGIAGFLNQTASSSDYQIFVRGCNEPSDKAKTECAQISGGSCVGDISADNSEANLDVQYAVSLSGSVRPSFYSVGGTAKLIPDLDQPNPDFSQNEPYWDLLTYLMFCTDSELPTTLSISYGENEQNVPASYANITCGLFAALGARGVSVIASSGDTGPGSACQSNDGKNTTHFLPIFPASCPFVTSIGGTAGTNPECPVSFSFGGFSDYFPRPSYQDAVISAYLSRLGTGWSGLYNAYGRGIPDVAAQSVNFSIVDKGTQKLISGTSAAVPVFAAIVSRLNGERLMAGRPPLGFLNPVIYGAKGRGFTDVLEGGSRGCMGRDMYSGLETSVMLGAGWRADEFGCMDAKGPQGGMNV